MESGVEKVDSGAGGSQHRRVGRPRQLRACVGLVLVAVLAAAPLPLAAQQEQRVVRGLSFDGNRAIDNYTLSTAIATSNSSFFASVWWLRWMGFLGEKRYLNEIELRRDVVRLLLLYRQSGYMSAVIDTLVRREGRDAFVTFRIYEGDPVRLRRFDLAGVEGILDTAQTKKSLPLRVGDPFNRMLLQASADTILSRLKNRGYPYAEVLRHFDVNAGELRADASLEAVPGPRVRIREVRIVGTERLDTGTVRKLLSLRSSDLFRQDRLYQSQRDLYGTGLFRSVTVALADSTPPSAPGDTLVDAVVRLVEGPRHRARIGAGYGTIDCFRGQGGWSSLDFLGGARTLDLTGRVSKLGVGAPTDAGFRGNVCPALQGDATSDTLNYTIGVTVRQPTFFSPRHSASFGVFAERRSEFKVYTRQAVGANFGVTLNARRNVRVTLGYGSSLGRTTADPAVYCSVFRVCDERDRALLASRRPFAAVTVTAVRDQMNSPLDPSEGSLVSVALMHASRLVGSDTLYDFNRGELEVSQYHPLGRRGVFAWRFRGGAILPARRITLSGQSVRFVPPDQRFYGGGPNSVRGYARNELGPRVYVTDGVNVSASPTGGNSIVVLNAELRFATPLFPDRMRVAAFVDVGQVWERREEIASVRGVRVTPGAGVRFATPLGPVRLDAAYNGYAAEPGPLYFLNTTDHSLTLIPNVTFPPARPASFWKRVVVQFAVGQAF